MLASVSFGENFVDWLFMVLGVLLGVVWPWLNRQVKEILNLPTAAGINWKPIIIIGAFSAVTAVLVLAVYRNSKPDQDIAWYGAVLAGYGFEAVLQKWRTDFEKS